MKTDKIFYTLFQVFPELIFQLIGKSAHLAESYKFQSVEIKELAFRLDGVFLPDENHPNYPIYFVEVQFQKDDDFYWRFITEIFIYLNQYKPSRPCHAIVIWAKRSLDESLPLAYQELLVNQNIHRIYLDQLNQVSTNSLGLGIIKFITVSEAEATEQVESLINQAKQEVTDELIQQNVIELIEKIIVYKFPQKSRQELEKMFNLTEWRQTKFYQEAKEEGKLEGKLEGKIEGKLEGEEEGKLKTVPLLLKLGLNIEQIAQELGIEIDKIRQFIASQNN
jgi:predicted transposase/invertase (TIGR01784 family)